MRKDQIVWLVLGIAAYYGFLRVRHVIAGAPWAPVAVAA